MDAIKKKARRILDNISKDELIQHFEDAGFTISEGTGRILSANNEDLTMEIMSQSNDSDEVDS